MINYLILFVATIAMFYKTMYCGYVVDDVQRVISLKRSKAEFKAKKMKALDFWKEALYGAGLFKNPKYEYAFNMAVHFANCSLIYKMSGSLIAALLYLVNPINNQTAIWMNGRRYALTILAVLLTWNFHILGIVLFPFCAWLHVSGIAMPLLFLWTKQWWIVPVGIAVAIIFGRKQILNVMGSRKREFKDGNENQKITPKKLILYVKSIGYNLFRCVLPLQPAMYHNFLFYFSGSKEHIEDGYKINADFIKGVLALSLLGYLMIFQHNFWAFWFLLFISQWCNLYQVTMNSADRYCSLANVGVMIMVAQYANMLPQPYGMAVIVGLGALYITKYQPLFRAYTSIENFYLYHLYIQPDLVNPRYFLAKFYLTNNDVYSAFATIKKGLQFRPHDFKFLLTMMECMFALNKIEPAFKVLAVAEKNIPLGEEEDCKIFFDGLKLQFKKELTIIETKNKLAKRNTHNGGKPIIKSELKVKK